MQIKRTILLVILIILLVYFMIHSCSEDLVTNPPDVEDVPSIICDANDIFFLDEQFGWAVGSHGTIISTSNGGRTWQGALADDVSLNDVHFLDRNCGWVVGKGGMIFRTMDGGTTWARMLFPGPPQDDDLYGVRFIDDDAGFIQGYSGVFKTNDGGMFWENNWLPIVPYRGAWDMSVVSGRIIYLLGSRWLDPDPIIIYRSGDGGETWNGVAGSEASVLRSVLSIYFISETTGWAGGGVIKKTVDGGNTWEMQLENATVREFCFVDENTGYAVGGGSIMKTIDGGLLWDEVTPDDERIVDLRGVYFLDQMHGWVCGRGSEEETGGRLLKHSLLLGTDDGGVTWTIKDLPFDYTTYLQIESGQETE
jgi:photosystem II stability/assembly factor-like uncharacterized protein